jgi:prepilin-type N-terminal cleavage/methylation domain-containing protein
LFANHSARDARLGFRARDARSGFTLIEALVALALLLAFASVAVPMMFQSRRILDNPRGRIAAQVLLRALLDEQPDRERMLTFRDGETDGLRWSVEARPLDLGAVTLIDSAPRTPTGAPAGAVSAQRNSEEPGARRAQWVPFRVAASVSWAPGQVVRAETVRLLKRQQ